MWDININMITEPIFAGLNTAINQLLSLDPNSLTRIHRCNGKILKVELLPFSYCFCVTFTDHALCIAEDRSLNPTLTLRGTPLQFLSYLLNKEDRQLPFAMEGDAAFGQEVMALMNQLNIDWEECLATVIGDPLAFRIGRAYDKVKANTHTLRDKMAQQVNEYVHEEACATPATEALTDFYNDVDELAMATERIAAKIEWLKTSLL